MTTEWLIGAVLLAAAYFIATIPTGYIIVRLLRRVDIRTTGSGSSGATNVIRLAGVRAFLAVVALDITKGLAAATLVVTLTDNLYIVALAIPVIVAGHSWPVYLGFRGGKGSIVLLMSTAVVYYEFWWFFAVMVAFTAGVLLLTRMASLASFMSGLALLLFLVITAVSGAAEWQLMAGGLLGILLASIRHLGNIQRLLTGRENAISWLSKGGA